MILTPLENVVGNTRTRVYHNDTFCNHKPTTNATFKLYSDESGRVVDAESNIYTLCSYCEKVQKIKSTHNVLDEVILHV